MVVSVDPCGSRWEVQVGGSLPAADGVSEESLDCNST